MGMGATDHNGAVDAGVGRGVATARAAGRPGGRSPVSPRRAARRIGGVALTLAAAALLSACGGSRPDSGPIARTPSQSAGQTAAGPGEGGRVASGQAAKVALLLPLSSSDGNAAAAARDMADAARMAVAGDASVSLTVRDTAGTESGAESAARAAVSDGDALILGPLFGANAKRVGQAVGPAGLNVITFSNTPSVAGGNIWLAGLLAEDEADRILSHAAGSGISAVGVYYPQSAPGETGRAAAQAAGPRYGVRIDPVYGYPRSFEGIQNSAGDYAQAHRAAGAQAALLTDNGQGLQAAASFLRYNGIGVGSGFFLGLGDWSNPALARESSMEGGRFPAPDPQRMAAFAARFQSAYGRAPTSLAWIGHDVAVAAQEMARSGRARGDDRPFGKSEITDPGGFQGATGAFRFTPEGTNRRALAVLAIGRDGVYVVDPAPAGPGV